MWVSVATYVKCQQTLGEIDIPQSFTQKLAAEAQQHIRATISQSLEANNHFLMKPGRNWKNGQTT
ncbi:hypothetical protein NMYAN_260022 [Nitrosomonas nitrosa]|uniref:Uncharacterized protein n=1 Tax=Nitrosomonas nitrosa TaxID=52442 RepID=A0A8H8Z142_9PROT|nr:hypothetical protein NMYAN_260022 [Nitrosomonas nitrosa]